MTTEIIQVSNFAAWNWSERTLQPRLALVPAFTEANSSHGSVTFTSIERVTTGFEIAAAFVSVFAIFVNICVLMVIAIGPRAFRTPTFFFISSLASADLLTGVTVLFAIFLPISDKAWERIALKGLAVVSFSASVNNLIVIAADRCVKIYDDRRYTRIFTNTSSFLLIALTWILAVAVFLIAPLAGWSCADGRCACAVGGMCHCDPKSCSQSFPPFTLSYIAFGVGYFYSSLLVMISLYCALFLTVRWRAGSQMRRHGSVLGAVPNRGPFVMIHRRREVKLAKTLVIVMGVFFVCWLPVTSLFIYDMTSSRSDIVEWFDYCLASAVIHPLVNPLIYSMRLPRMWITFKHLAYALWRRTARKPALPRTSSFRLARTPSTRSYVTGGTAVTSVPSFRRNGSVPAQRKTSALSASSPISILSPLKGQQDNESSDGSDSAFYANGDARLGPDIRRSTSVKRPSPLAKGSARKPVIYRNSARFALKDVDRPKVRRSRSSSVRLHNGSVVPRESLSISTPFNAESKIAWS